MARDPNSPEWFDQLDRLGGKADPASDLIMVDEIEEARDGRPQGMSNAVQGGGPLDERGHAELLAIYHDASENLRFAKSQQWRTLVYFTAICTAVVTIGVVLRWGDSTLVAFLLYATWFFSVGTAVVLIMLQSWHGAEHARIEFCAGHFTEVGRAAMRRKPRRRGDVHRYILLALMLVYVELVTISVTRMMWPRL